MLLIVLRHFRFLIAINFLCSIALLANAFSGISATMAIPLIVIAKIIGYGLSILIEKWFYAKQREYYFKNIGIAYCQLFARLFAIDTITLILLASVWLMVRNFS
ncbi:hypothetical protein ACFQRK_11865 [Parapedobacter sp. GCM10030251]|uniref:hypothetical protein n=1 Tax=Parapedobacter sp. GCM10030251 TaxID=3273419 RepID=UPI0036214362